MRRETIINWCEEHLALKDDMEAGVREAYDFADVGKGWSYITHFELGTKPDSVLFNIEELEQVAESNGFFIPSTLISEHNKIVVCATDAVGNPSYQLYGLFKVLEEYSKRYKDPKKFPQHCFYGKIGGVFDRSEKGKVMVLYSRNDDYLLEIEASLRDIVDKIKVKGVIFDIRFSNGLSELPRMLHGFDDPTYKNTGVEHYRITDPNKFNVLLQQARQDYCKYLFDVKPHL